MRQLIFILAAIVCISGCDSVSKTAVSPAESSVIQQKEAEVKPRLDEKIIDIRIIPTKEQVEPGIKYSNPKKSSSIGFFSEPRIQLASFIPANIEGFSYAEEAEFGDESKEVVQPVDIEVEGKKIKAPAGSEVHVTITDRKSGEGSKASDKGEAKSKGIGVVTDASDIVGKMNLSAPTTQLNKGGGGSASGGDAEYDFKLVTEAKNYFLSILGGLMIAGGIIVWIWLKQWKLGLGLSVAGFMLIGVDVVSAKYPWVFLLAFLAIGVAAFFIVRDALSKRRKEITLGTITDAVENAGPSGDIVKKEISKRANGAERIIKAEVMKMKTKIDKLKSKHA